ncbi:MAG: beta galactosidase jelly roll domain-containing protein [Planctomycetes bacterium]|nr:beta galactosidase jelly roll domain-containing protein [Planctomycetota bacterium]
MTARFRTVSAIACALLAGTIAAAERPERIIDLPRTWEFRLDAGKVGDTENWARPDLPAEGWKPILVPSTWEAQGYNYNGIAWYRTAFDLPADATGPFWLELPAIDETDTTFINGRKVGATKNEFQKTRSYAIDPALLVRGGRNVVVVKVEDYYGDGGIYAGTARIVEPGMAVAAPAATPTGPDEVALPLVVARDAAGLAKEWPAGWRDGGTADTRMRVAPCAGPDGAAGLQLDAWFPNCSGEYVQRTLPAGSDGPALARDGRDYLAFSYRSETEGELRLHLTEAGFTWGRGDPKKQCAVVMLRKTTEWTRVVVPFSWFMTITPFGADERLANLPACRTLSIGYCNNELRGPGKIELAAFAAGRFAAAGERIDLATPWRLARDPEDKGLAARWAEAGFDDAAWTWNAPGTPAEHLRGEWEKYDGVIWYRRQVEIPEAWRGRQIRLQAGAINDFKDQATLYLDGRPIATTSEKDKRLGAVLEAGRLQPGIHQLAIRYADGWGPAAVPGVIGIGPDLCAVSLQQAGRDPVKAVGAAMPATVGARWSVVASLPPAIAARAARMTVLVRDQFHRVLAEQPVTVTAGTARIDLDDAGSRRLFWGESLRLRVLVEDAQQRPLAAMEDDEIDFDMAQREKNSLAALPERFVDTAYGRLKVVDEIDAAVDPAKDPHPYKEGGIRRSWVGRRAYDSWVDGVRVQTWNGASFREATNNEWFGYRIGRQGLRLHRPYVLRVTYPEDRPRYMIMNIQAGRNHQGTGFNGGLGAGNPFAPYPQSGRYEHYDHIVVPDERTYGGGASGEDGARIADGRNGFWVFFFDIGRCYAPGYQGAGPAVARLQLLELPDEALAGPAIRHPEGQPRRILMADWEREPESPAADLVAQARFIGLNAIAPPMLKWGRLAYWKTGLGKLQQTTTTWNDVRAVRPADEVPIYDRYLAATRGTGLALIPRLEVGGSEDIPEDQRAIGANGGKAGPNRFHSWCSDLTQPAILDEWKTILNEVITSRIGENPQLGGVLWRIRSDRLPISYGLPAVRRFIAETGQKPDQAPTSDKEAAAFATSEPVKAAYEAWWHAVRRDFHRTLAQTMRAVRPDLRLWYYNWDPDGWHLGAMKNTPEDWVDYYSKNQSGRYYDKVCASKRALTAQDLLRLLAAGAAEGRYGGRPHHEMRMDLYRAEAGIAVMLPIWDWFLLDQPEYMRAYDTEAGSTFSVQCHYEEKGRWNVQGDNYESSEVTPGGPDFAMAHEVMACFHSDPTTLSFTTYTFGRGFVDRHRRFAQEYLALPAVRGTEVAACGDADVKVRIHPGTPGTSYLAVVHRGFAAKPGVRLTVPGTWPGTVQVTDARGAAVPAAVEGGALVLTLDLGAMELRSFRVSAAP